MVVHPRNSIPRGVLSIRNCILAPRSVARVHDSTSRGCYVTSKSEQFCNFKPEHSSRVGSDGAAGVLDGDVAAKQAHPDVLAHELRGHGEALSPQGDGGVAADQPADLHLQELAQLSRGRPAGGLVAMSRGEIAQTGVGPAVVIPPEPPLPAPLGPLRLAR